MLNQAISKGQVADAQTWFDTTYQDLSSRSTINIINKGDDRLTKALSIGKMYLFHYDPKYKDTLPYYDMYPLVIPIEFYTNGFLGINLHYLPPAARASLMSKLKKVSSDDKYNDKTKLNISYEVLTLYARQFSGVDNCIKRYLFSHVRSPFHKVSAEDWDKTVMLPLQKWKVNSNKKYAGTPPY